jgi:hypothetical protein
MKGTDDGPSEQCRLKKHEGGRECWAEKVTARAVRKETREVGGVQE